jgi:hypothetical protein
LGITGHAGEHGPIRWPESRSFHLPTQDCDLVAEDHDLDGELVAIPAEKPDQLEDSDGGEVAE